MLHQAYPGVRRSGLLRCFRHTPRPRPESLAQADHRDETRSRQMKLLIAELRASLPPLYSQEKLLDPVVHAKFFTPDSNWTWYVTEGQAEDHDFRFFGCVCGMQEEWGYFVLSELESVRGPLGLEIERDLYFEPGPFTQVMGRERRNGRG